MEGPRIFFTLPFFGGININETEINLTIVTLILLVLSLVLTHKMEKIPRKKTQILAEKIVITIDNLVEQTMGKRYMNFAPYMMTIFACSLIGSLIGLVGLRSTTQDFNTTLTWALATAFFIHYVGFKYSGFVGYLKSFTEPVKLLTPINLIGIVTTPMSMSLRQCPGRQHHHVAAVYRAGVTQLDDPHSDPDSGGRYPCHPVALL